MIRAAATSSFALALVLALALAPGGCARHDVEIEPPSSGRALAPAERDALEEVAERAFRDARARLDGLPPRLTLIVRFGKDVIPETGESGQAGFPGNVGLTIDPDRDVLAIIRTHVRACLLHELDHLARRSRVTAVTFRERLVSEGLATAFERDVTPFAPPWGEPPADPDAWTRELLALAPDADQTRWFSHPAAGRRWIGHRVGTLLVDRAARASAKSPADLVLTPTDEILRLANGGATP